MTNPDTNDSPADAGQAPWRKAAVEGGTTPPAGEHHDPSESQADVGMSDEDDGIPTGEEAPPRISPAGTVGPMTDMGGVKPKG